MRILTSLAALALLGSAGCSNNDAAKAVGGDDDPDTGPLPALSIAPAAAVEDSAGGQLVLTVTLGLAADRRVTVDYATADGSAFAGEDYTSASGTLEFPPGTTEAVIAVAIAADSAVEADETFSVTLSNPVNATLAVAQATAAIRNDDALPPDAPRVQKAENVLPPGQSGFVSLAGQLAGQVSGDPGDFGPNLDDQRLMYWRFGAKPGVLGTRPGTPTVPKAGVQIYRDAYGVPIVYAPTVKDLWHGVGYAVAQDRLFLMDAVRRMGLGTFGELTGCGGVPADIQQRTIAYTDAEYDSFYARLSQDAKDAVDGYVDGANAWRSEVLADPSLLPAEYALLTTTPAEFTRRDVLAAGVFITRFVAAEGGNEFLNVRLLQELETELGSATEARKAFQDLTWLEDPLAATSVPASVGSFSNQDPPPSGTRDDVFNASADWILALSADPAARDALWKGDGTGHSTPPSPCSQPTLPGPGSIGGGLGAGEVRVRTGQSGVAGAPVPGAAARTHKGRPVPRPLQQRERELRVRQLVQRTVAALGELRRALHGGSMAYAIGPSRTRDGGTLLLSGPQLGYTYPTLLVEYEIHSGDYHARGVSVPILPVVGIGYTPDVAWGLTTGYSKTIDSFIETICSTAQVTAGTCAADTYFHGGQWKPMSCRTETVRFRAAQQGLPVGPAELSSEAKVCRTVHGPIVARDDARGRARSLQFGMWMHEIDTIEGVRQWNKAKDFADFMAGAQQLTWNENVTFATRDGHFGFIHPGRILRRPGSSDMRLPVPGTGEFDFGDPYSFAELPKAIDPPQGYVANWNNKPALGWLDGEGLGATSRPGGPGQRVTSIHDLLATRSDWSFADLAAIDRHHGVRDHRAREYLPLIEAFRASAAMTLTEAQRAALDRIVAWDRAAHAATIDPAAAPETWLDTPGATIFSAYVLALRQELFGTLVDNVLDTGLTSPDPNDPSPGSGLTAYNRVAGVGSHVFDQSVMDNVVLRILRPESSGLAMRRDFKGARSRDVVMKAALEGALDQLAADYNGGAALTVADLDGLRRTHPQSRICSLTGVIGPGSDTAPGTSCVPMPYQDRGSWVHRVGWER